MNFCQQTAYFYIFILKNCNISKGVLNDYLLCQMYDLLHLYVWFLYVTCIFYSILAPNKYVFGIEALADLQCKFYLLCPSILDLPLFRYNYNKKRL